MISIRHLSTKTVEELSRRYELDLMVLDEVVAAGEITLAEKAIVPHENNKQLLRNKLFVVDKELRRRVSLSPRPWKPKLKFM